MATADIDSDLEEGEILSDLDNNDIDTDVRVSEKTVISKNGTKDARKGQGQISMTKNLSTPDKFYENFKEKRPEKDNSTTNLKYKDSKFYDKPSKRKRSSDSEKEKKTFKETHIREKTLNAKKDSFDIMREKKKISSFECEPPRKQSKFEHKKPKSHFSLTDNALSKKCPINLKLKPDNENLEKKSDSDSGNSVKTSQSSASFNGDIEDRNDLISTASSIRSQECDLNSLEQTRVQGQTDTSLNDLDTEDTDISSQNAEMEDETKETEFSELNYYESDNIKEITESDTANEQQFTESSSPVTHEFEIIDDLGIEEDDGELNVDDLSDEDLDDSEIYAWLEEGIDKKALISDGDRVGPWDDGPVEREKVVLKEKGHDPFEVLPEGWVVVTHNSGMPVYLHKQTRVCTLSKPYFLGPGSVRKHDVPVSAIPCLHYARESQKEKEGGKKKSKNSSDSSDSNEEKSSEAVVTNGDIGDQDKTICQDTNNASETIESETVGDVDDETSSNMIEVSESGINGDIQENHIKGPRNSGDNAGDDAETVVQFGDLAAISPSGDNVSSGQPKEHANETGKSGDSGDVGQPNDITKTDQSGDNGQSGENTANAPPVKIECAEQRKKENSLDPFEVRKYCARLFHFRTITVKKFKTWKDRRQHLNTQKRRSRPALPSNTKLITCSIPQEAGDDKAKRKEFVLNPTGKSYVCILHEYAQHTLRVQPRYVFRELENAQNPYSATVVINEVEYGTGYASSKKTAKMEAAKATLSILIPAMNQFIDDGKDNSEDYSFFDEIKIEDPRVSDLCNKAGQPSPYQILLECLKRNYGMGDTQCQIDVKTLKHQKSEYSLTVGKHTVTVVCKNKREGKQRAAQAMLQQLHPHITGLGSLLRLYGRSSWKSVKEKKKEEHSITELQSQARSNKPNTAVLDKLKEEMEKLQSQKDSIKSKGKMRVDSTVLPANVKSLDL